MNSYFVFLKKELKEFTRTTRFIVFICILLFVGISSAGLAKLTPMILKSIGSTGASSSYEIVVQDAVYTDAYIQFAGNMEQIGIITILVMFATVIAREKSKGTAILVLTKNLSRASFVLSKFTSAVIVWTTGFLFVSVINFLYTLYLFDVGSLGHIYLAHIAMWLYGILIIAIAFFASTISKASSSSIMFAFLGWILLNLSTLIGNLMSLTPLKPIFTFLFIDVNPVGLIGSFMILIRSVPGFDMNYLYAQMGVALLATFCLIGSSVLILRRQEI